MGEITKQKQNLLKVPVIGAFTLDLQTRVGLEPIEVFLFRKQGLRKVLF